MTQEKFTTNHLSEMTTNDLYSLIHKTIVIANPLEFRMDRQTMETFNSMKENKAALRKRMVENKKNIFTPELNGIEAVRKNSFLEIKRYLAEASENNMSVMRVAAERFGKFMKPYRSIYSTYNKPVTEAITETLEEMFDCYRSAGELLLGDAKTIGLEARINTCERANAEYKALYRKHIAETESGFEKSIIKIKGQVITSYKKFYLQVEKSAEQTPDKKIEALFRQIENLHTHTYSR